jgi:hypothetical protein
VSNRVVSLNCRDAFPQTVGKNAIRQQFSANMVT